MSTNNLFSYNKARNRACLALGGNASDSEIIVYLEKEIDDYREKLDRYVTRLDELTVENKRLARKRENDAFVDVIKHSTAADILKALAENDYNISINFFKNEGSGNDDT